MRLNAVEVVSSNGNHEATSPRAQTAFGLESSQLPCVPLSPTMPEGVADPVVQEEVMSPTLMGAGSGTVSTRTLPMSSTTRRQMDEWLGPHLNEDKAEDEGEDLLNLDQDTFMDLASQFDRAHGSPGDAQSVPSTPNSMDMTKGILQTFGQKSNDSAIPDTRNDRGPNAGPADGAYS